MAEIEEAWARPQEACARRRLVVVRLIAQLQLTVEQIMTAAEVGRQSLFTYRDKLLARGVAALLSRKKARAGNRRCRGAVAREFIAKLEVRRFRQARDAQGWIKKRTRQQLNESAVHELLRRLGGKPKRPRKSPANNIRPKSKS